MNRSYLLGLLLVISAGMPVAQAGMVKKAATFGFGSAISWYAFKSFANNNFQFGVQSSFYELQPKSKSLFTGLKMTLQAGCSSLLDGWRNTKKYFQPIFPQDLKNARTDFAEYIRQEAQKAQQEHSQYTLKLEEQIKNQATQIKDLETRNRQLNDEREQFVRDIIAKRKKK
jgi:predicted metal-dependent hydrolase